MRCAAPPCRLLPNELSVPCTVLHTEHITRCSRCVLARPMQNQPIICQRCNDGTRPNQCPKLKRGFRMQSGRTAVQLAAFRGSERCLRKVLHAGARPDVRDMVRSSPVAAAVRSCRVATHVIEPAAADVRCPAMMLQSRWQVKCVVDPTVTMVRIRNTDLTRTSPAHRATPNLTQPSHVQHGLTALHKAAVVGQLSCMRTLLDFHADVSATTSDGLTPAHLAAWKGQREVLRLLHSHRADLSAAAADGGTPLHEAVRSGDRGTVELLLQYGAKADAADKVRAGLA